MHAMTYLLRMMYMHAKHAQVLGSESLCPESLSGGLDGGAEYRLSRRKRPVEGSYDPPG